MTAAAEADIDDSIKRKSFRVSLKNETYPIVNKQQTVEKKMPDKSNRPKVYFGFSKWKLKKNEEKNQ